MRCALLAHMLCVWWAMCAKCVLLGENATCLCWRPACLNSSVIFVICVLAGAPLFAPTSSVAMADEELDHQRVYPSLQLASLNLHGVNLPPDALHALCGMPAGFEVVLLQQVNADPVMPESWKCLRQPGPDGQNRTAVLHNQHLYNAKLMPATPLAAPDVTSRMTCVELSTRVTKGDAASVVVVSIQAPDMAPAQIAAWIQSTLLYIDTLVDRLPVIIAGTLNIDLAQWQQAIPALGEKFHLQRVRDGEPAPGGFQQLLLAPGNLHLRSPSLQITDSVSMLHVFGAGQQLHDLAQAGGLEVEVEVGQYQCNACAAYAVGDVDDLLRSCEHICCTSCRDVMHDYQAHCFRDDCDSSPCRECLMQHECGRCRNHVYVCPDHKIQQCSHCDGPLCTGADCSWKCASCEAIVCSGKDCIVRCDNHACDNRICMSCAEDNNGDAFHCAHRECGSILCEQHCLDEHIKEEHGGEAESDVSDNDNHDAAEDEERDDGHEEEKSGGDDATEAYVREFQRGVRIGNGDGSGSDEDY